MNAAQIFFWTTLSVIGWFFVCSAFAAFQTLLNHKSTPQWQPQNFYECVYNWLALSLSIMFMATFVVWISSYAASTVGH